MPIGRRTTTTPAGYAIAAVGIVAIIGIGVWGVHRADNPSQQEVHNAADNAAYELERTPVKGLGLYSFDVQDALVQGNRGGRYNMARALRVQDKGHDSRGDLYEITTSSGANPVCLTVTVDVHLGDDSPAFPDTDVEDGRC